MKQYALLAGKGFCMGAADIVPGVSGGTMALILGIYPRLIEAIRSIDLKLLSLVGRGRFAAAARHVDALFLLWLGLGMAGAILFFTRVVELPALIVTHPQSVYSVFFGLICASLYLILRPVVNWRSRDLAWMLAGALTGAVLVSSVPVEAPQSAWFLCLSGAAAAFAMLLPGVSGAFVLLVLNQYAPVLKALGQLDLSVLAPFALGVLFGVALGSRAFAWCLHRFQRRTMLLMSGIVLGSLHALWPFRDWSGDRVSGGLQAVRPVPIWPQSLDTAVFSSLAFAALAALTVLVVNKLARRAADGR